MKIPIYSTQTASCAQNMGLRQVPTILVAAMTPSSEAEGYVSSVELRHCAPRYSIVFFILSEALSWS